MNIKTFIEDYPFINNELQRLQQELNGLIKGKNDTYCTLKAVPLTGMPRSQKVSDSVYDTVQDIVDRYDEKIHYYTNQINDLLDDKALFDRIWFDRTVMSHSDRRIVELRCWDRWYWPDIARTMRYSEKQCQRRLERVIEKMQCEVDKHAEQDN